MSNTVYRQSPTRSQRPNCVDARACRRGSAGYTLLEMLITMLVIALLSTLVGPAFINMIDRNRQQSAFGDMLAMLSTARTEAVSRSAAVVACGSSDQDTCNSNNWEDGWIIFVDDGNGAATPDDGQRQTDEELVRVGQQASGTMTIRTRNFPNAGRIAFTQDGFAAARGSVVICDGVPADAMALVLNLSGQPRMAVDQDADGFLNIDDDSEVSSCP